MFIRLRTSFAGQTAKNSGYASKVLYTRSAFSEDSRAWEPLDKGPWLERRELSTRPAIWILKIGRVLYKELFLARVGQCKMLGGDQMPRE